MKLIIFFSLLISLVYNYVEPQYVELPKYGSITVTKGYISLNIDNFNKGDKISIEIMIDSSRLPNQVLRDTYTLKYLQENKNTSDAFEPYFNTTTSQENKKSSSIFHYFSFKIKLIKKTKYLLFKDVYFYDAPITVKHTNVASVEAEAIVILIIFFCILVIFIVIIIYVIKRVNKNSEPKPQIPDTPLIPFDNNNNPNYETPYYEK